MGNHAKLILFATILGAIFRFWDLGAIPSSLNWDEIAIGYNAYSILHTGHDEFGQFMPTTFRSFDDYKSPLYIYLTIPSLLLFGKTEFAIRFASAFLGTLTIPMLALLLPQLLHQSKSAFQDQWRIKHRNIGVIAAFLLAITPWHVHFSRVAFEANIGLFFLVAGSYLLLKWLHGNSQHFLISSAICYACAIHSYANMRLLVPLLLIGCTIPYLAVLLRRKREVALSLAVGLLLTSPLLLQLKSGEGLMRFRATSILYRPEVYLLNQSRRIQDANPLLSKIFHNNHLATFKAFSLSYSSHLNFDFLFTQKSPSRYHIPGVGLLHFWMLPLITIGVFATLHFRSSTQWWHLLWLLFVAPIPAGLTWETPNAIRAQLLAIPLICYGSIGLWVILKYLQKIELQTYRHRTISRSLFSSTTRWIYPKVMLGVVGLVITISTSRMWFNYQTQLNSEFSHIWLFGRREMVQAIQPIRSEFDQVQIALSLEWAYLWFLWYGDITPQQYLEAGGTQSGGFAFEGNRIGNLHFKNFSYTQDSFNSTGILYVGTPQDFPKELAPGLVIETPEGQKPIYIVRS